MHIHLRTCTMLQNVARLQPLSTIGKADEQGTVVQGHMVQPMLNGIPTGEHFVLTEVIGKGSFGDVYACTLPNDSRIVVKKICKSKLRTLKTISRLSSELSVLHNVDLTLRHQNILYINDVLQSHSHIYIVMPLGGKVRSNGEGDGRRTWGRRGNDGGRDRRPLAGRAYVCTHAHVCACQRARTTKPPTSCCVLIKP